MKSNADVPEGIVSIELDKIELSLERLRRPTEASVKNMTESLINHGQLTPVIITQNHDHFFLIDGFKRYQAAKRLGAKTIKAQTIKTEMKYAKAMVYFLNRSGYFTMIQEAVLVKELIEIEGLTQSEAGILLDRHKSWVSRRLENDHGFG